MKKFSHKKSLTTRLRNHNGQMAIFVALIFQVLFVAFAMAINIGLVVHDKINLQNAVDLAAYYAAQKQAELLNVIAHQNYQIRQAYKLMAWRYQVLGNAGRADHPSRQLAAQPEEDYPGEPALCIAYKPLFSEIGGDTAGENICQQQMFDIPPIFIAPPIAGWDAINILFALETQRTRNVIRDLCQNYGAYNFLFTANAIATFRKTQSIRKKIIKGIAANMARPFSQMIDLNGDPVEVGIRKTLEKNLTFENFNGAPEIELFNSLEGFTPEQWLNELPIKLVLYYTDVDTSGGGCRATFKPANRPPSNYAPFSAEQINIFLSQVEGPEPGHPDQLSLGFEKNPWVMIYAAVRARTKPRQIFWPFGSPVQFEAKAYAQPFGGRIGPWYYSQWPSGATSSTGAKVDPVVAPLAATAGAVSDPKDFLPNYSRFPGDMLGLNSKAAQAGLAGLANSIRGNFSDYLGTTDFGPGRPNDALAFDPNIPLGGEIRMFEIAAIAPDLFDIAYYSIEPNFGGQGESTAASSYLWKLRESAQAMGIPAEVPILGDHGSREPDRLSFSVKDQMAIASGAGRPAGPYQRLDAGWYVRERAHLLVDWVHNDSFEIMEAISPRFGNCNEFDDQYKVRNPGSCLDSGGRTGYSVKIVAREYLLNPELPLGGRGQTGPILNPPRF